MCPFLPFGISENVDVRVRRLLPCIASFQRSSAPPQTYLIMHIPHLLSNCLFFLPIFPRSTKYASGTHMPLLCYAERVLEKERLFQLRACRRTSILQKRSLNLHFDSEPGFCDGLQSENAIEGPKQQLRTLYYHCSTPNRGYGGHSSNGTK